MKVLIIGLGSIAKKHIIALRKYDPKIELYALRSSKTSAAQDDVINIYSLDEVEQVSFAIVSNPTAAHADTIVMLVDKGVPMFIEKPLFSSLDHQELVARVKRLNIKTYVACNLRFLEAIQFIKTHIAAKRINEVNVYCGSYLPDWRPRLDYRTVYSANKEMGGGVHIDLIHEIDYVYWLFGKPIGVKKHFSNVSSLNISAFDYANYLLSYPTFNVNVQLNYYRRDPKRSLEIVCENGTFFIDLLHNKVLWREEVVFEASSRIADTYYTQMEFFINNILNGNVYFNDINEAYEILTLCLED
ncbi:Gfo/Idh/MocA family protein [Sphingobacterium pedocola]|uniref:Gfo/Idh/MocA family oxidoreductase n=1 Tax=Sphingobacterium pedocola TaxID=2082722 RepID=A0ABR9T9R7_9SPHI|nr:Gfo/Idh/MocA family oxidoreductase [Sphingobacterium pedocola]MBE8722050.1 gfo/Idh/MocA family oxidoreductase [Sphingobacterium pedocola]